VGVGGGGERTNSGMCDSHRSEDEVSYLSRARPLFAGKNMTLALVELLNLVLRMREKRGSERDGERKREGGDMER